MMPRFKRLLWRAAILAVAVNGFFLVVQYQQRGGQLSRHDYQLAAESLGLTLAALGLVAFLSSLFGKRDPKDKRPQ